MLQLLDTTLGAGDTGKAGGDKINANFRALAPLNRLTMGFAGDSIAVIEGGLGADSALAWALARDVYADLDIDNRAYANGGYMFALGGTTTSDLVTTQLPQIVARPPDVLFINSGTNNSLGNLANIATAIGHIATTIDTAQAAGVRIFIVRPISPRSSTVLSAAQSQLYIEFNARLREVCRSRQSVIFFDVVPLLVDPAASVFYPFGNGGTTGMMPLRASGSVTIDGIHTSTFGARRTAALWTPILPLFAALRQPSRFALNDVYDAINAPRGNWMGAAGGFQGANGTLDTVANAGVAAGYAITTSGGLVVTPTLVTQADGSIEQNLAFSGTLTADATCEVKFFRYIDTPAFAAVGNADLDSEMLIQLGSPSNMVGLALQGGVQGGSSPGNSIGMRFASPVSGSVYAPANIYPSGLTDLLFLRQQVTGHAGTPYQFSSSLLIDFLNGTAPGGAIRLKSAKIAPRSAA